MITQWTECKYLMMPKKTLYQGTKTFLSTPNTTTAQKTSVLKNSVGTYGFHMNNKAW